jgi:diaminopimelate decarboxylase
MDLNNNRFQIQGIDVLELCKKYDTPLYVYDTARMKSQYEKLVNSFSSVNVKVKYACKSLTNLSVLKYFKQLGSGLDTVSIEEVQMGILAGYEPHEIMYTPNCVSIEEIKRAVEVGVTINIDNISILEQFGNFY